jgi:solute carrier family 25 phosphate transporter 23/24/25/41
VVAAFIAGGVAGAVSRTIVSPLERLKILFQVQSVGREEYKMSIWKALTKMGREEGWRGFLRGNGTNCVRIIPYSAVQFGSYNFYKKVSWNWWIKDAAASNFSPLSPQTWRKQARPKALYANFSFQFAEPTPGADLTPVRRLLCGGLAGITSVTVTYPLDIVRTRLSIQSASFAVLTKESRARLPGMYETMKLMYKNEGGFLALYRGIIPTVAGVAPYVRTPLFILILDSFSLLIPGRIEFHDL